MTSPIRESRPIKRYKIHRNKDGAVLVTSKGKNAGGSLGDGDHVLGFSSDEDILLQYEEGIVEHGIVADFFNALDNHKDKRMTDKEFIRMCVSAMSRRMESFWDSWEILTKAGDLPKHDRKERARMKYARDLMKRLQK